MKQAVNQKEKRTRHSEEYKQHALARAERDGIAAAAQALGLHESPLYTWRARRKLEASGGDEQRLLQSEHARLKREVSRLEEENTFLKKAAAYFAKQPK